MKLPNNLTELLRNAGLKVVEVDGWETRSTGGEFDPVGVLNHHTGSSMKGKSLSSELAYARWMFLEGRSDLKPPLVQLALGRSGTVYIGAAGRCNHGGDAKPSGSVAGGNANKLYIGIEWMLSGTEEIPADMLADGITLNAVLTEVVTKTSVEAISCHYNTSVTGKWDIGDPHGIEYKGHRVLDVPKFREAVADRRTELYHSTPVIPSVGYTDITVGHFSAETFDPTAQWDHDCNVVFRRKYLWITGTEGGEDDNWSSLRRAAKRYGYKIWRFRSNWVAIKRKAIKRLSVKVETRVVVENDLVAGPGHDTAWLCVTFTHTDARLGEFSVISGHAPTKGRLDEGPDRAVNYKWNVKYGRSIGWLMARKSKGTPLAFGGVDSNQLDHKTDIFHTPTGKREHAITCWDELKKYPNTGHGDIDCIFRSTTDARSSFIRARAFNDRQLFLYSDHYLIAATIRVKHLKEIA